MMGALLRGGGSVWIGVHLWLRELLLSDVVPARIRAAHDKATELVPAIALFRHLSRWGIVVEGADGFRNPPVGDAQ